MTSLIRPSAAAAAALLLVASSVPVRAQDPEPADTMAPDTFALPGLVVTATRVPLDRKALPTPVTVLTGRELRAHGVTTVAQALRRVPGAAVARAGGSGAQTSLFLRGGESDYVQVLIDGVPVNDPGGAVDFAALSTDQVERIEVVRGPVSVLYGTDAVTGVVHIITSRGSGDAAGHVEVVAGSGRRTHQGDRYATWDLDAGVTGASGPLAYAVGGSLRSSDGLYPLNNETFGGTGSLRLEWRPAEGADIALTSRFSDDRSHFPTDGAGALVDDNAYLDRRLWTTSLDGDWDLSDRVSALVRVARVTREQTAVDEPDGPGDDLGLFASTLAFDGTRHLADARVTVRALRGRWTVGLSWEEAEAATRYTSESEFGPYDAEADFRRITTGGYVQMLARPVERLHLTLGTRVDDSDSYGSHATYRVGAALRVAPHTRVRAAAGRGFREPTFAERFGSGFGDLGNAGLQPERSSSREVGVEQDFGAATVSATWFDQRFEDLIQYTFTAEPGAPSYYNVGAARASGLEIEGRVLRNGWSTTLSYAWLDTEVVDPGLATDATFVDGQPLLRRPGHSGSLTAGYAFRRGLVSLAIHAVGEREDVDYGGGFPAPRVTLSPYATLDMAAEHALPFSPGRLLLRIENLLDTEYQTIAGFPAARRLVRLGVRLRFP